MTKTRLVLTDPAEAEVVNAMVVRLVRPEEEAEWNRLMIAHHYLGSATMVGEQLRYVAEYRGEWMALLGWSAAAYHLKGRDSWIGWDANQRQARLHLVASNARFCRLEAGNPYPNLASRALALNLERLSADWQAKYGHPIVVVESFVDLEWFRGTAYKVTGWEALGSTARYRRVREDFYEAHDRPKQLFVRELVKHACQGLRARQLPARWGRRNGPPRAIVCWRGRPCAVSGRCSMRPCPRVGTPRGCGIGRRRCWRSPLPTCSAAARGPSGRGALCPGPEPAPAIGLALLVQPPPPPVRRADGELCVPGAQSRAGAGVSTGPLDVAEGPLWRRRRRGRGTRWQGQPARPPRTSAPLPSGRFFPLNCSRSNRDTDASSGAALP
ncbi:MAG: DUF4338 domain-containing protein [Verrucomicrobia bacterium]|nr:DUF4338 domain-containing protein [Verrucomicrobiota bacterium]